MGDGVRIWENQSAIMSELTQGKELTNELIRQLHSKEACGILLQQIMSCYDNALALFHYNPAVLANDQPHYSTGQASGDQEPPHRNKRKRLSKRSKQVSQCSKTGYEEQLEDGFNWRKYGQKDILGANHPRAYYRCTHRYTQGCLATKLVQRMDNDPSLVELVYKGNHSCAQKRPIAGKESVHEQTRGEESRTVNVETGFSLEPRNFVATSHDEDSACLSKMESNLTSDMNLTVEDLDMVMIYPMDLDFLMADEFWSEFNV